MLSSDLANRGIVPQALDDDPSVPSDFRYWYDVDVRSVYDGDTIRVDIDLGLGLVWRGHDGKGEQIRLYGIDAWEVRGDERPLGLPARDFVRDLIDLARRVVINTILDDTGKYGRLLANVFVEIDEDVWVNVNEELVANGHAEWKDY
jgi:micrococcal nuclease